MNDKRSRMAARKELLLARASIERMELAAHVSAARDSLSPAGLLRTVTSSQVLRQRGPMVAMNVYQMLRRYPMVMSAASMVLAKVKVRGIVKVVKLGGGLFAAYQAFKVWRAIKRA